LLLAASAPDLYPASLHDALPIYVYFTYGMHWGSNAVCGEVGEGVGVLLRAAEPLQGIDAMRLLRPKARRDRDLASGPGKLSQALDRKSTRLNSSHVKISYAVFCL